MNKNSSLGGRFAACVSTLISISRRVALPCALLAVSLAALAPAVSQAAIFNYTDKIGTEIKFTGISENTHRDLLPLFGAPTLSGNTLDFTPINFYSDSQFAAPPFDLTDGLLQFMGMSQPGFAIQNITFAEGGALSVLGGSATANTLVDVSAVGFIDVFEVDNVAIDKERIDIELTFSFGVGGNGTWRRIPEGLVNGQPWTGSQFINIKQELLARGIAVVNGATLIKVNLDNSLYAQSELVGGAYIDKKDFFTVTTNIPEPTSCLLAMFGLVVGGLAARRSR
jgi:hypothetical protein